MPVTVNEAIKLLQEIAQKGHGEKALMTYSEMATRSDGQEEVEDIAVLEYHGKPFVSVI